MNLPLLCFAELDSTQSFLSRHPELGCCGVLARVQTSGRGQGTNRWEAAAGEGLCFSARVPLPELALGLVLQRAMMATAEALRPWCAELGLKWPNDLVVHHRGQLQKLGGVIGEVRGGTVLLGLGVNLAGAPELAERPIPPVSLRELTGGPLPEPEALARELLTRWQRLTEVRSPAFLWPAGGTDIQWEAGTGRCLGWEPDGRLRVEREGKVHLLTSGDLRGISPSVVKN